MRTSLSLRLVVFYAVVSTGTVLLTLWLGGLLVEREMHEGADYILAAEHAEIALLLTEHEALADRNQLASALTDHTMIDAALYFFQVEDDEGRSLFRSRNLAGHDIPWRGAGNYSVRLDYLTQRGVGSAAGGLPLRVEARHFGPLRIMIATSLVASQTVGREFRTLMAVGVPFVFLLSLAVGFLLSQVMLKPLRVMQAGAQRISATNLKERLPVPAASDELTRLAELLNNTFDRLERSFEQIRRFTADSSHELKTPLTVVRLQAEKVLGAENLADEHRAALRELLDEVKRLEQVINGLLLLARAEAEALPLKRTGISTAEYLEDAREDAETLADSEGRRFRLALNDDGVAVFDPSWMRQVLFNLLSNALKHSAPGGEIRLSGTHRKGHWEIVMEDEGCGVPADQLENIFDRFWTSDSNPPRTRGTGLGLAVCRSIVELHGGRIRAEARPAGSGLRIVIEIPNE